MKFSQLSMLFLSKLLRCSKIFWLFSIYIFHPTYNFGTNNLFYLDKFFVCVTEQHYVSIFFIRLWSVRKPLLFDTQNPGILGFSTAHKYKTKRQAKMKRDSRKKWHFCWLVTRLPLYLKSMGLRTDHKRVKKIETFKALHLQELRATRAIWHVSTLLGFIRHTYWWGDKKWEKTLKSSARLSVETSSQLKVCLWPNWRN